MVIGGVSALTQPLVYLHFHKAGGSTACAIMRLGPLNVSGHENCNCESQVFLQSLHDGDGVGVAHYMLSENLDVCFVEHMDWWPKPTMLPKLKQHVRIATTLREPWARLLSNYERDVSLCRGCNRSSSLESYMIMQGCYPSIRFSVQLPDFHVRSLSGKATRSTTDVASLNISDLDAAQWALTKFDHVFLLENAHFTERIAALARIPGGSLTSIEAVHESNNRYSHFQTSSDLLPPCIHEARAKTELHEQWLTRQSRLDAHLYEWASRSLPTSGRVEVFQRILL